MTRPTPMAEHAASLHWPVQIGVDRGAIAGELAVPDAARGVIIFAHGGGSGRPKILGSIGTPIIRS